METFEAPCLYCGEPVTCERGGLEEQGVLLVFCHGSEDCEDKYAMMGPKR